MFERFSRRSGNSNQFSTKIECYSDSTVCAFCSSSKEVEIFDQALFAKVEIAAVFRRIIIHHFFDVLNANQKQNIIQL